MKNLTKTPILLLAMLVATITFGQGKNGKPSKEKMKAMKIAYITEKIDLKPEEAEKFWPTYNEYETKMEAFHKAMRKFHKQEDQLDAMTDAEVEKMMIAINSTRQREIDLQKEYHQKFKAVIPIKKVAKLYKANHDFKRNLLKRIKDHRGSEGGSKGPPPGNRPH